MNKNKITMTEEEFEASGGHHFTLPKSRFNFEAGEIVRIASITLNCDEGIVIFQLANTVLNVNTYAVNIKGEIKWYMESMLMKIPQEDTDVTLSEKTKTKQDDEGMKK